MKLALYREHLARELRDLPDFMSQDVQSYTLTTAILARRIDQRLGGAIKTLSIRERIGKNRRLSFIKLVNMLLHYPRFRPDITNSYVDKTVPETSPSSSNPTKAETTRTIRITSSDWLITSP